MSTSAGTGGAAPISVRRERTGRRLAKRAVDILIAGALLVVSLPLLAMIAVMIRLDSPGPILFRQVRVGLKGRRFRLAKLRTMIADAEEQSVALRAQSEDPDWLLLKRDPRITRIGRVLRFTSLDELPQLWNVLRGEMSLVGPRPVTEADDRHVPTWARPRNDVPPGITGLWQVSGRTDVSFQQMMELDCEYVSTWSLCRDVVLLLRTVPAVLFARGVN